MAQTFGDSSGGVPKRLLRPGAEGRLLGVEGI
eukprot:CAMPEP_0181449466 /NCGR_PEP_ID=MMETSP1110-20121109/27671_1 /TAXON_ID=174948 /ORGANISM="Symbiodinium sp., Strain CCMP421" /LENGTH=31 /DNA_ID= /DNA_START= /DNA_END= /DNA_ORIENTATION=